MFFLKKKPQAKIVVYMTKMLKYKNILTAFQKNEKSTHVLLIYFFEQTKNEMSQLLEASGLECREITSDTIPSSGFNFLNAREFRDSIFPKCKDNFVLEMHPLLSISNIPLESVEKSGKMDLTYFTGLDEAVMSAFINERLIRMMENLGIRDDESIEHSMISKAVMNGQKKLEAQLSNPIDERNSQEDWIEKNGIRKAD